MKAPVYNLKGEIVREATLPDVIFAEKWNEPLVHQALLAQTGNRREPLAHAKNRSEVRGGGKKPWKQKGTGRARHGSIRSPLWKGGGVTHGPRNDKNYSKKLNKKMKRKAIYSVLAKKFRDHELLLIDSLDISEPKTKILFQALKQFFSKKGEVNKSLSALLVPHKKNGMIFRASANLPKTKSLGAQSLNIEDLLIYKHILLDERALPEITRETVVVEK